MITMNVFQRMSSKLRFSLNSSDKPAPSIGGETEPKRLANQPPAAVLTECSRIATKFYRPSVKVDGNSNIDSYAECRGCRSPMSPLQGKILSLQV